MPTSPPTVVRKRLGRKLRVHQGDQPNKAIAAALGWPESKYSRILSGHQRASIPDVRRLLDHLGVDEPEQEKLLTLAREAQRVGWWHQFSDVLPEDFSAFMDLENEASIISNFEESMIPGLLQTGDYARVLLRSGQVTDDEDDIERRLTARLGRQEIFDRKHPPQTRFVIGEAAIRQQIGGRKVLYNQLEHIMSIRDLLTVTVQVVPFVAGGHAATTSFAIFEFEDDPTVVYLDLIRSSVYVEKSQAVGGYVDAFQDARGVALSPKASADLIAEVMKEL